MANYKKMYLSLFNNVTTAIETLQHAQQTCENIFIETDDAPHIEIITTDSDDKE